MRSGIGNSASDPLYVTGGTGGGGGDASSANQTAPLANPGSDATKATAVQGVTGGKPVVTQRAQAAITQTKITLVAATPQTLFAASTAINGARILNWTSAPVYITDGTAGTPASGAPSDYLPAAVSGVPGQFEPPYAPVNGMRAVGAAAGDLTVETW